MDLSHRNRLQSLIAVADGLKGSTYAALCKAGNPPRDPVEQVEDCTSYPIFLPTPDGISATLLSSGCSTSAAHSLSDTFLRTAHKFQTMYQTTYNQTYGKLVQQLDSDPSRLSTQIRHTRAAFERQYRERILAAEQLVVDRAVASSQSQSTTRSKPVFNQEFVPLLEKYFEYNAYPSAPDRAALARKSMMTPRQIEVWFQNHRNRAKKDGKRLRKLTMDPLPLKLSFESLEKKMPFFVIPEAERVDPRAVPSKPDSDDESDDDSLPSRRSTPLHETCAFSHSAPLHAFPMTYPPTCDYDPFPVKSGRISFPQPVWARKPATARPRPKTVLDMDDFVLDFSMKLVIREPASRKQRRKGGAQGAPWFAATHTIAPSAPHPALVRTPHPDPAPLTFPASLLPAVAAPSSRLHPFRSPSPMSHPTTLVSVAQTQPQGSHTHRKVARLPKRTPKNASLSHRGISPATSDTSPSPSPSRSFSSRTSSFSSDTSDRRLSSSSSSCTSSSSTPTTPVLCTASLPGNPLSPSVSISGLDFPHDDDLFGDSLNAFSQADGIRGSQDKQSFNLDARAPSFTPRYVVK